MRTRHFSIAVLLAMSACATPFTARVTRFNQLPPQAPGGSFVVQPHDTRLIGSLEFRTYADLVANRLEQNGFRRAENPAEATYLVTVDYGVDQGREKIETRFSPGPYGPGFYGYGGYGWGHRGWGYGGFGWGGFYDPWWGGGWDYPEVYSYTLYTAHLDLQMRRTSSNDSVFEGHALTHSETNNLTKLMPGLVQGLFTAFPGRSGETIRVTIDDKGRTKVTVPREPATAGYGARP